MLSWHSPESLQHLRGQGGACLLCDGWRARSAMPAIPKLQNCACHDPYLVSLCRRGKPSHSRCKGPTLGPITLQNQSEASGWFSLAANPEVNGNV